VPGYPLLLPVWELACRAALARYRRQLANGAAVNAATLRGILRRNAACEFGRRHDFAGLARAADVEAAYAAALPVATYEDCREPFARMAAGVPDVMFPGLPRLFVSTSGTTGDPKLFPVTVRQQNAALAFIALLTPAARAACTPGLGFRQPTATLMVASRAGRATAAGIPVGNPSGAGIRRILKLAPPFWVFPAQVLTVQDYPTALYLHHYRQVNFLLDRAALLTAGFIQDRGFQALPIAASQIIDWDNQKAHVSHKKVGELAGLGWLGRNNLLIHPEFGSQIRLVTILTDMPLAAGAPLDTDCGECRRCAAACPAHAIKDAKDEFDHRACFEQLKEFRRRGLVGQFICGVCVKACPGGQKPKPRH